MTLTSSLTPDLLSNCELEPIHIPGLIQPHGVLAVLSPTGQIEQISANASSVFGQEAESLLTQSFFKFISDKQQLAVTKMLNSLRELPSLVPVTIQGQGWNAFLHIHQNKILLELEAPSKNETGQLQEQLRVLSEALHNTHTLQELSQTAADQVRLITGHDRVMIYRFDEDWHGEVVAESTTSGVHSYLGHHFPASDIPKQARDIFLTNWVRMIPNAQYAPVAVVPTLNPVTKAPLDLGQSFLRSVSPIHLQYLKNMDVGASLSIALQHEGRLWGLIACHHSRALHVPQEERFACELAGRLFSTLIEVKIEEEIAGQKRQLKAVHEQLCDQMKRENDLTAGLTNYNPNILDLVQADGAAAAILIEGQWSLIGKTPTHEQIERLTSWLRERMKHDAIFHTTSLPTIFPEAIEYKDRACGVMAIAIPKSVRNFVLWFRPEVLSVVTWAGDPKKNIEKLPDGTFKIEPRSSFEGWKETQKLRSIPWSKAEIYAACELRSSIIELDLHRQFNHVQSTAIKLKKAKDAAEAANSAKSSFLANMSHEIRTPLGAIMGFVNLLKDTSIPRDEMDEYLAIVERNSQQLLRIIDDILDLSKVEAGLMEIESINVSLIQILKDIQTAYAVKAREKRIEFRVTPLTSLPDIIKTDPTRLRQILHNVIGNAIKFTAKGSVELRVSYLDGKLELEVEDTGAGITPEQADKLFRPFAQADVSTTRKYGGSGLGLVLTRRLSEALGGEFNLKSSTAGKGSIFAVKLSVVVPVNTRLVTPVQINHFGEHERPPLQDMSILLVEDVPDNQKLISIMLKRAGANVEIANHGREGLAMVKQSHYNVILMDVQMPEMDGPTVVAQLRKEGFTLPVVAITAHASSEERARCLSAGFTEFLSKPLQPDQLIKLLGSFSSSGPASR